VDSGGRIKVTLLGSGTSTGVPLPGCACAVCQSEHPKNKRFRASAYVQYVAPEGSSASTSIVIDTPPDFRTQAIENEIREIDGVLYTHAHADHIFGLDDLRSYNFLLRRDIQLYSDDKTAKQLEKTFDYVFIPGIGKEGGTPPKLGLNRIQQGKSLEIGSVKVEPISVLHGKEEILAFKIGNFAYLTDCSEIPKKAYAALSGVEYLVIDALRERPHPTHFTIDQALAEVEKIAPKKAYLTHISHEVEHEAINAKVIEQTKGKVELAYDRLSFYCD
jgi:phosphoribosyl 1,2-cyclic phosphate phosphodiesterase